MKAALLVESLTGNTWQAAEMIADKLQQERWTITGLSRVRTPDLASVEQADVVLVGTWTSLVWHREVFAWLEKYVGKGATN
jgi:flavodoxin